MSSPDPTKFDLSKLGLDVSKMRPTPGVNPFAGTREEAIANSAERIAEFQKAYPNVDFKGAIVEPTVNFYYDMKEKLDPETYNKHQDLMKEMMTYLMPPGHSYPFTSPSTSTSEPTTETKPASRAVATNPRPHEANPTNNPPTDNSTNPTYQTEQKDEIKTEELSDNDNEKKLALAQETFWKARDLLKGNEQVLKLFDSVYLPPDRPVEVMLEQLQKCFSHMPRVHAALAADGSGTVKEELEDTVGVGGKAVVGQDAPVSLADGKEHSFGSA